MPIQRIIYSVSAIVDPSIKDEWLKWMQTIHIPECFATGLFTSITLAQSASGDTGFRFDYALRSQADYDDYLIRFAPALQQSHRARYGAHVTTSRDLLQVISIVDS